MGLLHMLHDESLAAERDRDDPTTLRATPRMSQEKHFEFFSIISAR
jgi:hypothetical protein